MYTFDTFMNKRQSTHREQFSASLMEMSGAYFFRDLRREKEEGYFSKITGAKNFILMGLSLFFVCVKKASLLPEIKNGVNTHFVCISLHVLS